MTIVDPDFNVKVGDSLVHMTEHHQAKLRNIYVDADYNATRSLQPFTDSIEYGGYYFPYREKMKIKPQIVAKQIILEPTAISVPTTTTSRTATYRACAVSATSPSSTCMWAPKTALTCWIANRT